MPQASRGDLDHSVVSKEQALQFVQPALGRSTTALSKKYKRTTHKKQTIQKDFHKHCQKEREKKNYLLCLMRLIEIKDPLN